MNNKNTFSANVLIPRPDTKPGPGLEKLKNAENEATEPLAAFNAEKDEDE